MRSYNSFFVVGNSIIIQSFCCGSFHGRSQPALERWILDSLTHFLSTIDFCRLESWILDSLNNSPSTIDFFSTLESWVLDFLNNSLPTIELFEILERWILHSKRPDLNETFGDLRQLILFLFINKSIVNYRRLPKVS